MSKLMLWLTSWWWVNHCRECNVIIPPGSKVCNSKWCEKEDAWEQASGM